MVLFISCHLIFEPFADQKQCPVNFQREESRPVFCHYCNRLIVAFLRLLISGAGSSLPNELLKACLCCNLSDGSTKSAFPAPSQCFYAPILRIVTPFFCLNRAPIFSKLHLTRSSANLHYTIKYLLAIDHFFPFPFPFWKFPFDHWPTRFRTPLYLRVWPVKAGRYNKSGRSSKRLSHTAINANQSQSIPAPIQASKSRNHVSASL